MVSEATFLGNIVDYQIDIGGGVALRVQGDRRDFREAGTEVLLTVPVADCVLMNDETDLTEETDGGPSAG